MKNFYSLVKGNPNDALVTHARPPFVYLSLSYTFLYLSYPHFPYFSSFSAFTFAPSFLFRRFVRLPRTYILGYMLSWALLQFLPAYSLALNTTQMTYSVVRATLTRIFQRKNAKERRGKKVKKKEWRPLARCRQDIRVDSRLRITIFIRGWKFWKTEWGQPSGPSVDNLEYVLETVFFQKMVKNATEK